MSPRDDVPPLILKIERRRLIPASALDQEVLLGLRDGTDLEAKVVRTVPSRALRAYWAMMSAIIKVDDRWPDKRSFSNACLLSLGLVEEELLLGGSRMVPMSLKDMSDPEIGRLIEIVKRLVYEKIVPGLDVDTLLRSQS